MEYRRLGSSGLKVSVLGLGCNNFGGRTDERQSNLVLDRALEIGVNFIDTANQYSKGESEEIIGRALKSRRRSDVVLATKGGSLWSSGPNESGASRKHITDCVEDSLSRLETDYIDLYYIHRPDPNTPIEETLRALDDLVRQGKIRYIGSSNYAAWQACEALFTSRAMGLSSFICAQNEYSMLNRGVEKELAPFCSAHGVGIVPYWPLSGGFLTGKYRQGEGIPQGSRFDDASKTRPAQVALAKSYQERFLTESNFSLMARLEEFAGQHGHTVGEMALAWLASNPAVSSIISGASRPEQVDANAKGVEWAMSPQEISEVNEILDSA